MCTEMIYKLFAILKSVTGQKKHYITIIVKNSFYGVASVFCSTHTCISPLSSCLIKTLTVAARAVIHVIAEDNPVISQWCLMPGKKLSLTISQMDQFIYVILEIGPQS